MKELRTHRLILRAWEPSDASFLLDLESRTETMRYLGPGATLMPTMEEALASIGRRRAVRGAGQGIWAVARHDTGRLIGNLLCKPMSEEMQRAIGIGFEQQPSEIGWHLHPAAQGQGCATEAARAVLGYANQANADQPVFAIVDPRNEASQKICDRLGLQRFGRTRGYASAEHLVYVAPSARRQPVGLR